eukprot:GDKJ01039690.1.p1 GENE.GDKJ01039690.1~~GDKJ01039690.1.p1  ORF type:complete len:438 (-),score=122.02 GDKJ01039690.1:742-2055(-)
MFFGGDFPFGAGGMPGGGMGGRTKSKADTNKYYDLLGVPKDADTATIKKAFRKQALEHHPDRGGDGEKFKEISKAHEVLTDAEKRRIYDQVGEDGLDGGAGGGMDASDVFSTMFGGMGGMGGMGGGRQRVRRGEDVTHTVSCSLSHLYCGTTKKMALNREILCDGCKGTGGKNGKSVTCQGCGGKGRQVVMQRMGMMAVQQVVTCRTCNGSGSSISEADKCPKCNGKQLGKCREVLSVEIEKGMRDNQKVVFKGKGDEKLDHETGDVVFIVKEEQHPLFKRKGEHLVIERKITLLEALTGFKFMIEHLDGRKLLIQSTPSAVYKPGDKVVVKGEGMPIHGRSHTSGHLVVMIDVEFPKTVEPDLIKKLSGVLPAGAELILPTNHEEYEEHFLEDPGHIDLSGKANKGRAAYHDEDEDDDDDDHHHHGGGVPVGCSQA